MGILLQLRDTEQRIQEREARKKHLLRKFIIKMDKAPLLRAIKKWNWQKLQLKKVFTDQRESVRSKYITGCYERAANISTLRYTMRKNHRVEKECYDVQYRFEMGEISKHESELKRILTVKANH